MSLKAALTAVSRVEHLPALAVELGFAAAWHPLNWPLGRQSDQPTPGFLIGRRDGLLAIGEESTDPPRGSRRLANGLGNRGLNAVVFSLDPARRLLSISATGVDCPVATIDLDRVRAIDERILERSRTSAAGTPFEASLAWAEAIAGQSIGQRFFQEFRRVLDAGREALPKSIPGRDRHGLALLSLSRVLFLYFVAERGWLDGRHRFLREELDRCLGGPGGVDHRLLRPLFFGTLNRPPDRRSETVRRFGKIPFLNGGLFEPHPLERRWRAGLPDRFWADAFDDLFERYHFTIAESADHTAIGPDMLGRVFEGVMDPDERSGTGAFYTPIGLVDRLVDRTLDCWLAAALGPGPRDADRLLGAVRAITVLDPAVGSGAFLMGALKRLVAIRIGAGESAAAATRAVVTTNLYGVDLNPSAVRLAELRLWLAVIQAEDGDRPEAVAPLPNLDALVRQGDSVVEPVTLPFAVRSKEAAAVAALRRRVVVATGRDKRASLAALRQAELRAARAGLDAAVATIEGQIIELTTQGRSPGLFGERPNVTRGTATAITRLRKRRAQLRAMTRRLAAADELPWFHYQTQFADVMESGGFDLVVGNPPWIRAEAIGPAVRESLKARYRWFRSASGRGFRHLPDLSVAFLERALELVRPGGAVGFLVPSKLLTAQYGAAARVGLGRQTTLEVVAPLDDRKSGFDAMVYPLALVARRAPAPAGHLVATGLEPEAEMISQETLGAGPWRLGDAELASLWEAAARHPSVGDRFVCRLGLKTGADPVFLDPPEVPQAATRLALRGRDLAPFRATPTVRLLWTHDQAGAPLTRLAEPAAAWLAKHRRQLVARADYRSGPYWAVFRVEVGITKHRVVWPDLARRLAAVALIGGRLEETVPLNTCYWIGTPDDRSAMALAAWLNSRWISALARATATVAASGFRRFNAETVARLPLPTAAIGDLELRRLGAQAHRGSGFDQTALDRRVAGLLGVNAHELEALERSGRLE